MTLRLYDTATRSVRPFEPLVPGKVSLYHCGATVQFLPHIGHLRGAGIVYDVLRRWLEYRGFEVTQVRNVTDIDDKILTKAAAAGRPWWEWATTHERAFADAYDLLGCLRPSIEPRATGHIPQIQTLIAELIDAGHAYAAGGDVYFAVRTQPDYGFLSGQRIDEMQQGEPDGAVVSGGAAVSGDAVVSGGAVEPGGAGSTGGNGRTAKRDPADFTLWKAAKPGEPSWESPWGPGRPGWHIECTAMARTYLGSEFDIHGGGLDLIFPHHENEAAQAHGAGLAFARYWMHSYWVTMAGEKMSKSLGNTLGVEVLTRSVRPIVLRYYLVGVHYRSSIEYSPEALADAARAFDRVEAFLHRAAGHGDVPVSPVPDEFAQAMDDDLAVPRALAVMHDAVRAGNAAAGDGDWPAALDAAGRVRGMLAVLGLDPFASPWTETSDAGAAGAGHALEEATGALLAEFLDERGTARAAKDFATADAIRDRLARAGFAIEDTPDGPLWSVAEAQR